MDAARYAALFLSESREHLRECARLLAAWERAPGAREPVDGLFRALHSLKGMAATMGHEGVAALAHAAEHLLDGVRRGAVQPDGQATRLVLRAVTVLEHGVESVASGATWPGEPSLVAALTAQAGGEVPVDTTAERPVPAAPGRLVRVLLDPASPMRGARAALVLQRAAALGTVSQVLPSAQALAREGFDGRFAFRLDSPRSDAEVESAVRSAGDVAAVQIGETQGSGQRLGDRSRQVRVDLDRLDEMLAATAELVGARNRLVRRLEARPDPELAEVADVLSRQAAQLHSAIMAARLTPVGHVFERFPRAVREVARELGRDVGLQLEGADIELDRATIDDLADPVLHLLRNAVDHGIEPPAARLAAGKPAQGRIRLAAMRDRNTVAIVVEDDGRGIDRERVLAKAKALGAVPAGVTALTDDQLLAVLGRPGFTTADTVSTVSGRGVGIDVVLTRARSLGASVSLATAAGRGTTFTLRVPLTLAILRGFMVGAGDETYAVPLTFVREVVDAQRLEPGAEPGTVRVRGEVLPAVSLPALVGLGDRPSGGALVLEAGARRLAMVVERLGGQQELVAEPFAAPREMPRFIGGGTVLGDGRPALILDATALLQGSPA